MDGNTLYKFFSLKNSCIFSINIDFIANYSTIFSVFHFITYINSFHNRY